MTPFHRLVLCACITSVLLWTACDSSKPSSDISTNDAATAPSDVTVATDELPEPDVEPDAQMVDAQGPEDATSKADLPGDLDSSNEDVGLQDAESNDTQPTDIANNEDVTNPADVTDVTPEDPCKNATCDEFAECSLNAEGQAVCACKKGYEGDGSYCKVEGNPCEGYVEPGCANKGCPQGEVCDMKAECVPGMCVCDKKSGLPYCTPNCMGGVCVPNPQCEKIDCDLQCKDGLVEDEKGCPTCKCLQKEDLCVNFNPNENCGPDGKDKDAPGCQWDCVCSPETGEIKCPEDPCGPGTCNMGAYCQGSGCANPICYPASHPKSLILCQGVVDSCCGEGECVNGGYCTGGACDNPLCYDPQHPVSKVMCGDIPPPPPQCGVGACDAGAQYCNECTCYDANHPLSEAICGCLKDNPGQNTFQKVYGHFDGDDIGKAGVELSDGGFLFGGWNGMVFRTDKYGEPHWINLYEYLFMEDVVANETTFFLLSSEGLVATDWDGTVQWAIKTTGYATTVALAPDGGVVVGGRRDNNGYLTKISANGTFLWSRTYAGDAFDWITHIEPLDDGYALLGVTKSFGASGSDYLLIRTDLSGQSQWARMIGTADADGDETFYYRVQHTTDAGFIVAGTTFPKGGMINRGLAIKLSGLGDVEWATMVGGEHGHDFSAVTEVKDGYVFFGTSKDVPVVDFPFDQGKANVWLCKLGVDGQLIWNRAYGEVGMDGNYVDGGKTSDGGLFLIAHSHNYFVKSPDEKQQYVVKTDSEGHTEGCCNDVPTEFVTSSANVTSVDIGLQLMTTSFGKVPAPLTVTVEPYDIASRGTVCERSRGFLCGGLSTGYLDMNVPFSLAPTPVGCNCTP